MLKWKRYTQVAIIKISELPTPICNQTSYRNYPTLGHSTHIQTTNVFMHYKIHDSKAFMWNHTNIKCRLKNILKLLTLVYTKLNSTQSELQNISQITSLVRGKFIGLHFKPVWWRLRSTVFYYLIKNKYLSKFDDLQFTFLCYLFKIISSTKSVVPASELLDAWNKTFHISLINNSKPSNLLELFLDCHINTYYVHY